jgi:hypothetical protein
MVLITPPTDGKSGGPSSRTAESSCDPTRPQFAQVASPSEEAADAFAAAAALAALPISQPDIAASSNDQSAATISPTAAPQSLLVSIGSSKLLLWSAVGSTMFVLGGLALGTFRGGAQSQSLPSPTALAAAANDVTHASIATVSDSSPPASANEPPTSEPSTRVEVVAAKPESEPATDSTAAALPNADPTTTEVTAVPNSDPTTVLAEPIASDPQSDSTANLPPAPVAESSEPRRVPILKFDPLDFDPSRLSLGAAIDSPPEVVSRSVADEPPAEPDAAENHDDDPVDGDLPRPLAENPSITVRLGPMVPEAAGHRDNAHALGLRLGSFTATDMPLARFVAVVSDMAGVSITLNHAAFDLAGVSPRTPVTVHASDVTIEQLLQTALAKHRLEPVDRGNQLSIALANCRERSTKTHDVADLLNSGASDARLVAETIEKFVTPASWREKGGAGTIDVEGKKLRIEQTKAVHHEIVVFCERLRLARGLRQRTRYPANRLSIDPPYREIDAKLSHATTFTFVPWTRLADLVRHWEEMAGLTILVDWGALAELELTPATPISCSAINRPWGEVLQEILEPLGLAWWAVDGETIQITTQNRLANIERTEFYTVPKATLDRYADRTSLIDWLLSGLSENGGREDASVKRQLIEMDAVGGLVIVRGNPHVHRHLAKRLDDVGR